MAGKPLTQPTPLQLECARHFDAIVLLIEAGATVREAIPRVSNSLTFDSFRKWARVRPSHQARLKAAQRLRDAGPNAIWKRPNRKPCPPQAAPARDDVIRHFDAILAAIADGAEVIEASKLSGRDYTSFNKWVNRDPQMKRRFAAAVETGRQQTVFSDANFDRALVEMTAWDGVLNRSRFSGISYGGIYQRTLTDPAYHAKYEAAIIARNERLGIVHVRYEEADYLRLIERMKAHPRRGVERIVEEARAEGDRLPNDGTLRAYAQRNAVVRFELDEVRQTKRRLIERARRAPPATRLSLYELRRPLLENELFRKASALLKLHDSQDVDDIRSDAILAMLESREVTRSELIRAHHRKVTGHMASLDEELAPGFTRMHTLTSDPIFEVAY